MFVCMSLPILCYQTHLDFSSMRHAIASIPSSSPLKPLLFTFLGHLRLMLLKKADICGYGSLLRVAVYVRFPFSYFCAFSFFCWLTYILSQWRRKVPPPKCNWPGRGSQAKIDDHGILLLWLATKSRLQDLSCCASISLAVVCALTIKRYVNASPMLYQPPPLIRSASTQPTGTIEHVRFFIKPFHSKYWLIWVVG